VPGAERYRPAAPRSTMRDAKLFIGDAHLHPDHPARTAKLARFLKSVGPRASELFILGDLFDFWFGYKPAIGEPFEPVLAELRALRADGVRMHYIAGNHDFFPGPFFAGELEASIADAEIPLEAGGRMGVAVHGDLADPTDAAYMRLRATLRSRPIFWGMRLLPTRTLLAIAQKMSHTSRAMTEQMPPPREEMYEAYCATLAARGFDFTVMGHWHTPGHRRFAFDGRPHDLYIVGDWISQDEYVIFEDGAFRMERFED